MKKKEYEDVVENPNKCCHYKNQECDYDGRTCDLVLGKKYCSDYEER